MTTEKRKRGRPRLTGDRPPGKTVHLVCSVCGHQYWTTKYAAERAATHYCSNACKGEGNKGKPPAYVAALLDRLKNQPQEGSEYE